MHRINGKWITGTPKSDAGRRTVALPSFLGPILTTHMGSFVGEGDERPGVRHQVRPSARPLQLDRHLRTRPHRTDGPVPICTVSTRPGSAAAGWTVARARPRGRGSRSGTRPLAAASRPTAVSSTTQPPPAWRGVTTSPRLRSAYTDTRRSESPLLIDSPATRRPSTCTCRGLNLRDDTTPPLTARYPPPAGHPTSAENSGPHRAARDHGQGRLWTTACEPPPHAVAPPLTRRRKEGPVAATERLTRDHCVIGAVAAFAAVCSTDRSATRASTTGY